MYKRFSGLYFNSLFIWPFYIGYLYYWPYLHAFLYVLNCGEKVFFAKRCLLNSSRSHFLVNLMFCIISKQWRYNSYRKWCNSNSNNNNACIFILRIVDGMGREVCVGNKNEAAGLTEEENLGLRLGWGGLACNVHKFTTNFLFEKMSKPFLTRYQKSYSQKPWALLLQQ